MFSISMSRKFVIWLSILLIPLVVPAADWPTYRGNNERTGATAESLAVPLALRWQYDSPALLKIAWAGAEGRVIERKLLGHRVKFDDAIHPAVVGGRVYFGSSVDHRLHCVELKTGRTLWSFFTAAPIRLAPTVTNGRVYFGSDDGRVYCPAGRQWNACVAVSSRTR